MLIPHQKLTVKPRDIFSGFFRHKHDFSKYIPRKMNFVGSGRAGLWLILKDIKSVGIPSFTWKVVLDSILTSKTKPDFIDSGIIPEIEDYKGEALILPYHFGFLPDIDKIRKICKKNNVILIEDCAQALGAKYKGELVGNFGDYSVFSFGISKNIGFLGGLVNKEVNLRKYPKGKVIHLMLKGLFGNLFFNPKFYSRKMLDSELVKDYEMLLYSMDNYSKNVVMNIYKRYNEILKTRRENAEICIEELDGVIDFVRPLKNTEPSWLYFVLTDKNRDSIIKKLLNEKVDLTPLLSFKDLSGRGKKAGKAEKEHFVFALYRNREEIDFIIKKIKKIMR